MPLSTSLDLEQLEMKQSRFLRAQPRFAGETMSACRQAGPQARLTLPPRNASPRAAADVRLTLNSCCAQYRFEKPTIKVFNSF